MKLKEAHMQRLVIASAILLSTPYIVFSEAERKEMEQEEVAPDEDLMREHGILNRLLLIYQEISRRIDNHESFPVRSLVESVHIVRSFLEDYHEKLEENFVFPLFEKAGRQVELVKALREQHNAGRDLTDFILKHSNEDLLKDEIQRMLLSDYLKLYVRMFRPHAAREDTVLFPEFKKLISKDEYNRLGDVFEDKEHQLFGANGFEKTVAKVSEIEKQLGIYNLSQFTPQTMEKSKDMDLKQSGAK
ncbi:MAG: hemerythrin [Parachlamydia sp.]|nr:MAG: hemerythrin [Parachlamydia sp.]